MFIDTKVDLKSEEESIKAFEKEPVKKGLIMFYGDSGFTRWKPQYDNNPRLEDVILGRDGKQACVNHGFGGATADELLYYYDRAVKPWAPRVLVLQTFGNDMAKGYAVYEIMYLKTRIAEYARADFPGIKFYLCGNRPTLKGREMRNERKVAIKEHNELLKEYCEKHDDCVYVDQLNYAGFYDSPEHIGDYEHIREDMFVEDKVHYNPTGYGVYGEFFKEVLKDVL